MSKTMKSKTNLLRYLGVNVLSDMSETKKSELKVNIEKKKQQSQTWKIVIDFVYDDIEEWDRCTFYG